MEKSVELSHAHLRIARPSDNLSAVVQFYRDGLGFQVLYEFHDHDGFDGVMLGHQGAGYHLEFTRKAGHAAGRAPTADNLLVFYLPDPGEWQQREQQRHADPTDERGLGAPLQLGPGPREGELR